MKRWWIVGISVLAAAVAAPALAQGATEAKVTVGSPSTPFPRNKQNEPTVTVDPLDPSVVVSGSNDEIDLAPCDGSNCPFTPGVGVSGVYFSFTGGASWTQPTYTGYSARLGTAGPGPIGTVPHYYENGLASDGDPALAFGPTPGSGGHFSWDNGSRLYYANLAANLATIRQEQTFKGFEAIAVAHTDDLAAAASNHAAAWGDPSIVTERRQSSTTFSDKEAIAADNAASSPDFGNVYVCYTQFKGQEKGGGFPASVNVSRSTDGGDSFSKPKSLSPSFGNSQLPGRQGCSIATDSRGNVYVVWEDTVKHRSVFELSKSTDGGRTFGQPDVVAQVTDVGKYDGVRSISFDGVAGARTSSFPSLSIANGAPTGTGAPNTLALGWSDGADGLNHEHALVRLSTNGGRDWSSPVAAEQTGDRPDFAFLGLSPNGRDLYLVYNGFPASFQSTTANPRTFFGVVRHADVTAAGLGPFGTLGQGAPGDARASSANALIDEFIGDYNTVAATNAGAVAVFNDARNAADCPAIDAYRQSIVDGSPIAAPAPATDCAPTFGNTDIYSSAATDPTP